MAWVNGGPGSKIPESTKQTVRDRQQGWCNTIDPRVCTGQIDQFDHISNIKAQRINRAEANDADLIQGLCEPCHKVKTQAEAQAGRRRGKRPPPPHPADQ